MRATGGFARRLCSRSVVGARMSARQSEGPYRYDEAAFAAVMAASIGSK